MRAGTKECDPPTRKPSSSFIEGVGSGANQAMQCSIVQIQCGWESTGHLNLLTFDVLHMSPAQIMIMVGKMRTLSYTSVLFCASLVAARDLRGAGFIGYNDVNSGSSPYGGLSGPSSSGSNPHGGSFTGPSGAYGNIGGYGQNGNSNWGTLNRSSLPYYAGGGYSSRGSPWGGISTSNSNPYTSAPSTGQVRSYSSTLAPCDISPDGVQTNGAVCINGQFPGPLIEANYGDTISVKVTNNLVGEGTRSVSWLTPTRTEADEI